MRSHPLKLLESTSWSRAVFLLVILPTCTTLAAPIPHHLAGTEKLVLPEDYTRIIPIQRQQVVGYFDQWIKIAQKASKHTGLRRASETDGGAAILKRRQIILSPPDLFEQTKAAMLDEYRCKVGVVRTEGIPLRPRTQLALITDKYVLYHVMIDVCHGVELYGQLLIPRKIDGLPQTDGPFKFKERAAAVICQHGLNESPDAVTGLHQTKQTGDHEFGRRLAEHGYVVFAPLILLQEPVKPMDIKAGKSAPVGRTHLAMVVAKTQRAIDFLQTLPFVAANRIGYYGFSTGGYSAIQSAPLLDRLVAIICSGDCRVGQRMPFTNQTRTSDIVLPHEDPDQGNSLNRFTLHDLTAMTVPRAICIEAGEQDATTMPKLPATDWSRAVAIYNQLGLANRIEVARFHGKHEIHGMQTIDFLDRFLRPSRTVGRDYEYDLRRTSPSRHPLLPLLGGDPCLQHRLDNRPETRLRGRFWIPSGARELRGMALKLSRDGHPGPLEVRFGSAPGQDDLGVGTLTCDEVLSLYEYMEPIRIKSRPVREGQLVYYEIRASAGRLPEDHYQVFGPLPPGGRDWPAHLGLSYRVLTDRPQDVLDAGDEEPTFHRIKQMVLPYHTGAPAQRLVGEPAGVGETGIDRSWMIHYAPDPDRILSTVAVDLQKFLDKRAGIPIKLVDRPSSGAARAIELRISKKPAFLEAIDTEEGYRVNVGPDSIQIIGRSPRGVMRGVYYIEEKMRFRGAACLQQGKTTRNCKFRRRISTIGGIVELGLSETSHPLPYVNGVLQQLSRHGFNAIWIIVNVEDAVFDSRVFPELNDPETPRRFERLRDVVDRARRYGIDVLVYYMSNYNHPVPESFYEKHPDCRGTDWGNAMCTSNPQVRRYLEETTRKMFEAVPGLGGLIVIFDTEGFRSCAMGVHRTQCPRCRHRTSEEIVLELLQCLYRGMRAGNPQAEMIAWSYRITPEAWVNTVISQFPKGMILEAGFSQGTLIERGGIKHITPDYNITSIGPPALFVEQYDIARAHGNPVIAKTESAASQEFLCVPYIPCMEQWYRRIAKISQFDLDGLFATYNHYGYTNSRPVDIMLWNSWSDPPPFDQLLEQIITRDFGSHTIAHVRRAWQHVTRAIRNYPYSNWVSRSAGGPIHKGPSQPLWLGEGIKTANPWRAWQNDLNWTKPWGPQVVEDCFHMMEDEMAAAAADLSQAHKVAEPRKAAQLTAEIRVVQMMQRSLHTMRNLIRWVPVRDAYNQTDVPAERARLRKKLIAIGTDELANAKAGLLLAKADSRFGEVGQPMGARRGGLFNAALIRFKIGQLEDVLYRQLDVDAP